MRSPDQLAIRFAKLETFCWVKLCAPACPCRRRRPLALARDESDDGPMVLAVEDDIVVLLHDVFTLALFFFLFSVVWMLGAWLR